jgi:hypothetical protein
MSGPKTETLPPPIRIRRFRARCTIRPCDVEVTTDDAAKSRHFVQAHIDEDHQLVDVWELPEEVELAQELPRMPCARSHRMSTRSSVPGLAGMRPPDVPCRPGSASGGSIIFLFRKGICEQ